MQAMIEHGMRAVTQAEWVDDRGLGAGDAGGRFVVAGSP